MFWSHARSICLKMEHKGCSGLNLDVKFVAISITFDKEHWVTSSFLPTGFLLNMNTKGVPWVHRAINWPTDSRLHDPTDGLNTRCVPVGWKLTYRFLPTNISSIEAVPALHLDPIVPFTHSCARVATTFQLTWRANLNTRGVRNTKGVQCFARITSCACP